MKNVIIYLKFYKLLAHIHSLHVVAIVQYLQVDNDKRNLHKYKFLCVVSINMVNTHINM